MFHFSDHRFPYICDPDLIQNLPRSGNRVDLPVQFSSHHEQSVILLIHKSVKSYLFPAQQVFFNITHRTVQFTECSDKIIGADLCITIIMISVDRILLRHQNSLALIIAECISGGLAHLCKFTCSNAVFVFFLHIFHSLS